MFSTPASFDPRSKTWFFVLLVKGRNYGRGGFPTREAAEKAYREKWNQIFTR